MRKAYSLHAISILLLLSAMYCANPLLHFLNEIESPCVFSFEFSHFFSFQIWIKKELTTNLIRLLQPGLSGYKRCDLSLTVPFRCLTYTEATSILRPFFFAVHPDFFYQQPAQRAKNEHSLKLLNARLVAFSHGQSVSAMKREGPLTFYMRKTALSATEAAKLGRTAPDVKPINIQLTQPTLSALVHHILDSSELPLTDYQKMSQKVKTNTSNLSKGNEKVVKHRFYNEAVYETVSHPVRFTALSWLTEHLPKAIEFQAVNQPIRNEISAIRQEMFEKFLLRDIVWSAEWTPSSHLACLRSLNTLLSQKRAQPVLEVIKGRRIILTRSSGWSIFDDILLNVGDVSEAWMSVLARRHFESSHVASRPQLSALEKAVSTLLCGAKICRHPTVHDCTRIIDYYKQVRRLFKSLYLFTIEEEPHLPKDLFSEARIAIEDVGGALTFARELDMFLVPAGTPAFLIVEYLLRESSKSRSKVEYEEGVKRYKSLSNNLVKKLGLAGLRRDSNVSLAQGTETLEKLTAMGTKFLPTKDALSGLEVCIGRYFAVNSSGVIYLPWDAEWI